MVVEPGQPLQAAVDGLPPTGGRVLLLPGTHDCPAGLTLREGTRVHVAGAPGLVATISSSSGPAVSSAAVEATVEGLVLRRECTGACLAVVRVTKGGLTLQGCDVAGTGPYGGATEDGCHVIQADAGSSPTIRGNVVGGGRVGIFLQGSGTQGVIRAKGVIEGNKVASCSAIGVYIYNGASPVVVGNTVAGPLNPNSSCGISSVSRNSPINGAIMVRMGSAPILANNTISGSASCGIYLWEMSSNARTLLGPNTISGCAKSEVHDDVGARTLAWWQATRPYQSFDALVAPGQPLQAVLSSLPAGRGRVLLLPGAHAFLGGGVVLEELVFLQLRKPELAVDPPV